MEPLPKLNISDQAMSSSRLTFRRKGTTYVVKNTDSNEDVADIFHLIDEMYEDTAKKSTISKYKATIYKFFDLFFNIFICIAGAIVGSFGAINNNFATNNTTSIGLLDVQSVFYVQAVLGFAITAAKALASLLNLEQRSISMKQISVQLRRIARAIKMLKTTTMSVDDYIKKMDEYNILIDELDIDMFGELTYPNTNKQVQDIQDAPTEKQNDTVIPMNTTTTV
jgi:hypothetical protein